MLTTRDAIVLTFGGIRTRLYGGQGTYTPAQPAAYPSGNANNAINCLEIVGFTALREELPQYGGVGKAATITLRAFNRKRRLDALFGPTSAGVNQYLLSSTLAAENDTATVVSSADISDLPDEGYLYLKHETLFYTEKDDETGTFTLHETLGRGALASNIRQHLVDNLPARSFKPAFTDKPIYWAHRKAVLTLHNVFEDGTIEQTPKRELLRGTLRMEPEPDGEQAFTLQLISELAKFDRFIGSGLETTVLVDGWYVSDGVRACELNFMELIQEDSITGYNRGQSSRITEERLANAGSVTIQDVTPLKNCFATARGNFAGVEEDGPLLARVGYGVQSDEVSTPSAYNDVTNEITLSDDNMPAVDADDIDQLRANVVNALVHRYATAPARMEAGLHRWPSAILQEFNKRFNCTRTAEGGFNYIDARVSADGTRVFCVDAGFVFNSEKPLLLLPRQQIISAPSLWYPIFRLPDGDPIDSGVDQNQRYFGITIPPIIQERDSLPCHRSTDPPRYYQYVVPATAFWQGSKYILIRDNILPAATPENPGTLRARRSGANNREGAPLESVLQYEAVEAQNDPDGNLIGYKVTITDETIERFFQRNIALENITDRAYGPFGNWNLPDGRVEAQIEAYAELKGDPRVLLLQIMLSGSGGLLFPDETYSVLPRTFGISVDPAAVDIDGIRNYPLPRSARNLAAFRQIQPISARDLLEGILRYIGAGLVMVNIDGTMKITLVPVRLINGLRAVYEIRDRDWVARLRPGSGKSDDKQSSWQFSVNYDSANQRFTRNPTLHDADVIDSKDGAESAPVKLEVRGLNVENDEGLLGTYQMLRYRYGTDIRVFEGSIGWDVAQNLSVGQVILVSIATGLKADGTRGVTQVPMQIEAIAPNPIQKASPVRLIFDPARISGFAPVATVEEVVDADTVILSDDDYSFPGTADWQYFLEDLAEVPEDGVPIICVHVGEEEDNEEKTITAVDMMTFEVTIEGHGLAVGDRIRPRDWNESLTYLKVYVHFKAPGAVGLGTNNDPPFKYA